MISCSAQQVYFVAVGSYLDLGDFFRSAFFRQYKTNLSAKPGLGTAFRVAGDWETWGFYDNASID